MKQNLSDASAVMSVLTTLSALPYEKDIMGVIPPAWTPKVLLICAIATVVLRILSNRIKSTK